FQIHGLRRNVERYQRETPKHSGHRYRRGPRSAERALSGNGHWRVPVFRRRRDVVHLIRWPAKGNSARAESAQAIAYTPGRYPRTKHVGLERIAGGAFLSAPN